MDENGVYDPANFNDRILLDLIVTTSEAELHVLKARLRGGILNKVKRGEYRCVLPTGLIYNEVGEVVLHPDLKVRETILYLFQTFARVCSSHYTVKAFRDEGLRFPSCIHRYGDSRIIFQPLTASTVIRVLHNPRYTGAYAYGRRHYRKTIEGHKSHNKRNF